MDKVLNYEIAREYRSYRRRSDARRQRECKAFFQKAVLMLLGIAVVILAILLFTPSVNAEAESTVSYEKRIVSEQVERNEQQDRGGGFQRVRCHVAAVVGQQVLVFA